MRDCPIPGLIRDQTLLTLHRVLVHNPARRQAINLGRLARRIGVEFLRLFAARRLAFRCRSASNTKCMNTR